MSVRYKPYYNRHAVRGLMHGEESLRKEACVAFYSTNGNYIGTHPCQERVTEYFRDTVTIV